MPFKPTSKWFVTPRVKQGIGCWRSNFGMVVGERFGNSIQASGAHSCHITLPQNTFRKCLFILKGQSFTLSHPNLTVFSISLPSWTDLHITVSFEPQAFFPSKQTNQEPYKVRILDGRLVVVNVAACVTDVANVDVIVVSTRPRDKQSCIDAGIVIAQAAFPGLQFYNLPKNTKLPCQCDKSSRKIWVRGSFLDLWCVSWNRWRMVDRRRYQELKVYTLTDTDVQIILVKSDKLLSFLNLAENLITKPAHLVVCF